MDKPNLAMSWQRAAIEKPRDVARGREGETCSADRLTYAVDDRVVVPTCATTDEYCRLSRSHSVGLTHKCHLISATGGGCILRRTPKCIGSDRDPFVAAKSSALLLTQSALNDYLRQMPSYFLTKTYIILTDQIWTRSCRSAYRRVQRRTGRLTDTTERPLTLFPVHEQSFCYPKDYQALRPLYTAGMRQRGPDDPISFVTSVASHKPMSKLRLRKMSNDAVPLAVSSGHRYERSRPRLGLHWVVLAVVDCIANATVRYQARRADIIVSAAYPAHARDCGPAAYCKDLPMGVIGAQAVAGVEMPQPMYYTIDYGYTAQLDYGGRSGGVCCASCFG